MKLRDYQQECIEKIHDKGQGNYLVCMATGLGKTATFTSLPMDYGRTLVLAHREELIFQPKKYYKIPVGIEMAKHKSNGEDVVIASVQSLIRRLNNFTPEHFGRIIIDEAHHAKADSYKSIIDYFYKAKQILGFTATPKRGDRKGLDSVFSEIIFNKDILFGIQNGYLSDIECLRVKIDYDLSKVKTRNGDYAIDELQEEMLDTAEQVADVYRQYAKGQTIIFATSVQHAYDIAEAIGDEAVVIEGKTKNRDEILKNPPRCIVNCMVLTEGFDMPSIETVIMARPTKNESLYMQCVGRGTRLFEGKDKLRLIDCVGVSSLGMCTAPSLVGVDTSTVPQKNEEKMNFESVLVIEKEVLQLSDTWESWKISHEIIDLWKKKNRYDLHDVNFFRFPNGDLKILHYMIKVDGLLPHEIQEKIDIVTKQIQSEHQSERHIWDKTISNKWGKYLASDRQKEIISNRLRNENIDVEMLTKLEASNILNKLFHKEKNTVLV